MGLDRFAYGTSVPLVNLDCGYLLFNAVSVCIYHKGQQIKNPPIGGFFLQIKTYSALAFFADVFFAGFSATSSVASSTTSATGATAFFAFTSRSTNSIIAIGAASP